MHIQETLQKLWAKTQRDETTDCWLWEGAISHGYGETWIDHVAVQVHRLSAIIHLGLNPHDKKQIACHKSICPNKNCWNPEHLYIGSVSENRIDSPRPNQHTNKTHCKYGHSLHDAYITNRGIRRCRECAKLQNKATYDKNKIGN